MVVLSSDPGWELDALRGASRAAVEPCLDTLGSASLGDTDSPTWDDAPSRNEELALLS